MPDPLDQDPTVNDDIDLGPVSLQPLLRGASDRWNRYVVYNGGGWLTLTDTACDETVDGDYRTCVHAAEHQRVDVPKASVCAGLTMRDSLDAFEWECVTHDGGATFVSTGLAPRKGLRDLIDFATHAFKPMAVTLTSRTGSWTSAPAVMWSNAIRELVLAVPDGPERVTVSGDDVIWTISGDAEVSMYSAAANGMSIVSAPGVKLVPNRFNGGTENVCFAWDPSNQFFYDGPCVLEASKPVRLWIEIDVGQFTETTFDGIGIDLDTGHFVQLRNVSIEQDYRTPVQLQGMSGGRVSGLVTERAQLVSLLMSNGNLFQDIRLAGSALDLRESSFNAFERVTVFGSDFAIALHDRCVANTFTQTLSFGHTEMAMHIADAGNLRNTFAAFTFASTGYQALGGWNHDVSTFHMGAVLNSGDMGFTIIGDRATVSDLLTSEHEKAGINVDGGGGPQRFTGQIRSANNNGTCYRDSSVPHSGFDYFTCEPEGLSDPFVLDTGFPKTASSFVGNVASDSANADASGGVVTAPARFAPFDFAGASSPHRGWATSGAFLTPGQRDCAWMYDAPTYAAGKTVQLVDFALRASDTVVRNRTLNALAVNAPFVDGAACPAGLDGNNVTSDIMQGEALGDGNGNEDGVCDIGEACRGNVYLRGAVELLGDGFGDDDGLCETNERCLYAPNFGAYQGHGDGYLAHRCAFTNGVVSGARIYAYPVNGY